MTTPLLGLSEIAEGVANQTTLHNTALRQLETRLVRALSMTTAAPPSSPVESDSYIIPAGATGAWSGKDKQIAAFIGGGWSYVTPGEGVRLWVNDLDAEYVFNGTAWVVNGGDPAAAADAAVAAHVAQSDPHPQYLTQTEGDARYAATTAAGVTSVNGHTGAVTLAASDVGALAASTLGAANGAASLDASGKLQTAQLPNLAIIDFLGTVADQAAMLALSGQKGDWCARSDNSKVYVITGSDPTQASAWTALSYPTGTGGTVTSVGLSAPGVLYTVSGSPVTGSGTLALALKTQAKNAFLAGPTSGADATPTMRAIVAADLPVMGASGASHAAGIVPDPGATAGTTKYLREDGTWSTPPGTATSASVKLTTLRRNANLSVATGGTAVTISWDAMVQDDVSAWSSGAPTNIVVPAGYTKVRINSYLCWTANGTGGRWNILNKNGIYMKVEERFPVVESANAFQTGWLTVTPGDVLTIMGMQTSGATLNLLGSATYPGPCEVQFEWM